MKNAAEFQCKKVVLTIINLARTMIYYEQQTIHMMHGELNRVLHYTLTTNLRQANFLQQYSHNASFKFYKKLLDQDH